jgi:hypothetical protein
MQFKRVRVLIPGILIAFAAGAVALLATPANAQNPKYKEGDRVEVDTIEATNPANANFKKGTITKVDLSLNMVYTVQVDPLPGQLPEIVHVPIRPYAEGWLRPLGGAAPKIETNKLGVDENNTVIADRELLDCKNLKQPPARNGQPLPSALARKLIQCLVERPAEPGSDGARKMDISEFAPGAPRRWNPREDTAFAGTANSLVYPVRVKWTQTTFYRTSNDIIADKEQMFTCYVEVDKWYCGYSIVIKEGEKQRIQVK